MRSNSGCISVETGAEGFVPNVHSAVRELVTLLECDVRYPDCGDQQRTGETVLMDVVVDGARYLLVRMLAQERDRLQLSPREYEIVRMVAKGHPNKVIADVLNISSWTVCTHLRRIFAKMGVGSRAAMVAQLLERGVVPPESRTPAMRRRS